MQILKLREVFAPGGMPSITYVGREHLELEQKIIYSLIMMALAKTGPKAKTSYDSLRTEVRALIHVDGKMPQKNEITSALSHMTSIAKTDIKGEPALEWVKETNEVVITDPFLIFYMRHADLTQATE